MSEQQLQEIVDKLEISIKRLREVQIELIVWRTLAFFLFGMLLIKTFA